MATTARGTAKAVYQPKRSFFRSRQVRRRIAQANTYSLLLIGSFVMLLPLAWLVRSSFMGLDQIFAFPPEWIPDPFVWQNYPDALEVAPFARYFLNTMVIEFFVVTGTVASATISAYGFARLRWKGRDQVFAVLMTTMMLPGAVTLIPAFIIWSELGIRQHDCPSYGSCLVRWWDVQYLPAPPVLPWSATRSRRGSGARRCITAPHFVGCHHST